MKNNLVPTIAHGIPGGESFEGYKQKASPSLLTPVLKKLINKSCWISRCYTIVAKVEGGGGGKLGSLTLK